MNKVASVSSIVNVPSKVLIVPFLIPKDQETLYFAGNDQANVLVGNDRANKIDGFGGDDRLYGGKSDDSLYGGDGNDYLSGGAGMDVLYGGAGDDRLVGGSGFDQLHGGTGQDTMTGGADADYFYFEAPNDSYYSNGRADIIADFSISQGDHIIVPSYIGTADAMYMTNNAVHDIDTAHTLAVVNAVISGRHPDTVIVSNPNGDAYVFLNLGFDPGRSYANGIVLQGAGAEVSANPALVLDHVWGF